MGNPVWLAPIPALEGVGNPTLSYLSAGRAPLQCQTGKGSKKGVDSKPAKIFLYTLRPQEAQASWAAGHLGSECQRQAGERQAGGGPK